MLLLPAGCVKTASTERSPSHGMLTTLLALPAGAGAALQGIMPSGCQ
jgi:hypothetical protein